MPRQVGAQYAVLLPKGMSRENLQTRLKNHGIPTAIYYPKGIHEHPPYANYPITQGGLAITEDLCPTHPSLAVPCVARQ